MTAVPDDLITVTLRRGQWLALRHAASDFDTCLSTEHGRDGDACLDAIITAVAAFDADRAAAEAAGPEPGLAASSVAGYTGLLEDGLSNPENPELDGDE